VYGEYQETEGDYCCVLAILENQYQNGEPLTITWDGEQRRDFTHVDDIVDGLMRCSEHFTFMGEEFELGFGKNYSINEVADAFGKDYPREYIDRRPGEMLITLCTDSNANKLLDWEAKTDIIDYVQQKYKSSNRKSEIVYKWKK
jgi:UDP-glucose 4-epimerase